MGGCVLWEGRSPFAAWSGMALRLQERNILGIPLMNKPQSPQSHHPSRLVQNHRTKRDSETWH